MQPTIDEILSRAHTRTQASGKIHAGDLTPEEAHAILQANPKALLIDVRSHPELDFAGLVPGCCHVPWQLYPGMTPNPHFTAEITQHAQPGDLLLLLCRTGGRSLAAAEHLAALGYQHCYNILGGLEGRPNEEGVRGTVEGWKAAGLPWRHK